MYQQLAPPLSSACFTDPDVTCRPLPTYPVNKNCGVQTHRILLFLSMQPPRSLARAHHALSGTSKRPLPVPPRHSVALPVNLEHHPPTSSVSRASESQQRRLENINLQLRFRKGTEGPLARMPGSFAVLLAVRSREEEQTPISAHRASFSVSVKPTLSFPTTSG
ncbi:hypothetical protein CGRA01v4_13445 [Colletotrichum graminicola]|nr:hypothetical protein CGRA01v4_13445 [Colletotrichum graminicola]